MLCNMLNGVRLGTFLGRFIASEARLKSLMNNLNLGAVESLEFFLRLRNKVNDRCPSMISSII